MTGFALVSTTVGSEADARDIARELVATRLAACVQIGRIQSVYRWRNEVEEAAEYLMTCKIATADFQAVEAAIRERHAYDVPEIIMMEIAAAHVPYLEWMREATGRGGRSGDENPIKTETATPEVPPLRRSEDRPRKS